MTTKPISVSDHAAGRGTAIPRSPCPPGWRRPDAAAPPPVSRRPSHGPDRSRPCRPPGSRRRAARPSGRPCRPGGPGRYAASDGDDDAEDETDDRGRPGSRVRSRVDRFMPMAPMSFIRPTARPTPAPTPSDRADDAEQQRLDQHGPVDLPAAGADGPHQADLAGALGDQHREGVDDQEDADEEGDPGEAEHRVLHDVEEGADVLAVRVRGLLLRLAACTRPRPAPRRRSSSAARR